MAGKITVKPNQSMSDVVIQATGGMSAAMQFCKDNGVAISDIPVPGTVYIVSDAAIASGSEDVLRYLNRNEVTIGTLGDTSAPLLHARILLRPVLQHVPNTTDPPAAHAGMYDFDLKEAPGFIHVHAIPNAGYPNPNCIMDFQPISDYMSGMSHPNSYGKDASGVGPAMMSDKDIFYNMLWVGFTGHLFAWDAGLEGASTFTFRDVNGNMAMHNPFLILDDVSQNAIGYMIADLDMDVVSATDITCTVRLTRSHPSTVYPEYATHSMIWLLDAVGGSPDPLDPTNPDKRILTFPGPGIYSVGVATNYTYLTYTWPPSRMTMLIEVY